MTDELALSPDDLAFLQEQCARLRAGALRLRTALTRLSADADTPRLAVATATALVAWIESAQANTATLRLIRRSAKQAGARRIVRQAHAPLRTDLPQAGALLIRLRVEHGLRRLPTPSVPRPRLTLPSGVVLQP